MRWDVVAGDILDLKANVLICSANPYLNLSGGVGGAFAQRYGWDMQTFLHDWLKAGGRKWVPAGTVVCAPPCGSPYTMVIHAVGVDAFYSSSVELISKLVADALEEAAKAGAVRVALTAVATGYGPLGMGDFGVAIVPLLERQWPPIEEVVVGVRHKEEEATLRAAIGK